MHFLYTINHSYVFPACVSILSIIENNKEATLCFHIITSEFTLNDFITLDQFAKQNDRVKIMYYRLEDYPIEKYDIPSWRGTQIANARLFFQEIIKLDGIDRLLYLDADTIVVRDLTDLFTYNQAINAVEETTFLKKLKKLGIKRYFNTGVLLFDIDKWIQEDFLKRIIDFKGNHKDIKLIYPDQDLLNISIGEDIGKLPLLYNVFPYALIEYFHYNEAFYSDEGKEGRIENIKEIITNATIYHSAGLSDIKPWHENKVNPLNEVFLKYAKELNPTFKREERKSLERFLSNQPELFYFLLYLKNISLKRKIQDCINQIRKVKRK